MAQVPLFASGFKGGTATPGGKSLSRGSRMGSRVGSTKNAGGRRGTAASLGAVPEDDVLQQSSRVSSVRSARHESATGSGAGGSAPRLSEQALLARQDSTPASVGSGAGSTIGRQSTAPQRISSTLSMSDRGIVQRDVDGRSVAPSMGGTIASSVGTAVSDASKGEPPFVDQIAKVCTCTCTYICHMHMPKSRRAVAERLGLIWQVQRLQRSRLHGRFQREARMQRRWEELKGLAVSMQQQQQLVQKLKS